ncbi:MAG: DUF1800 family protein [Acidobacteriota bacterium]
MATMRSTLPAVLAVAALSLATLPGLPVAAAQDTERADVLLERGIQMEVVDGDIAAAISVYKLILARFPDNRVVASQALWHLGQCYEQSGAPDARPAYERLVREYGDSTALANRARSRLVALMDAPSRLEPVELTVRDVSSRPASPVMTGPNGLGNFVVFSDLAVHNRATGESRRLLPGTRSTAYPVVSPEARNVAYVGWAAELGNPSSSDRAKPRSNLELRMVGIDGSGDRLVMRSSAPWLRPFAFSPDGRHILVTLEQPDGVNQIALVSVADGSSRVLSTLRWRTPQNMSFSPDGLYVAYEVAGTRTSQLRELVVVPINGDSSEPTRERRYAIGSVGQPAALERETRLAIHVLNRLTFGPRFGDIDRVRSTGIDAYIDQQLHPEDLADPVVDGMLASFTSLGMSIPDLLAKAGPVSPIGLRRRATVFERREAADRRGDGPAILPGSSPLPMGERAQREAYRDRPRAFEIHAARLIRAIHSERQLFEVMVDFWMNHFSINLGDHQLTAHFEENVVRSHALGRFEDLLKAVARHPRMLYYLDNWRSSAPADVIAERTARLQQTLTGDDRIRVLKRLPFLQEAKGLNENYARELMELHTLGVDGGYTQQDIIEVAKVLSGWTISSEGLVNGREDDGVFTFDPVMHVDGDKQVLGRTIAAGGVNEGEQLLTMLAAHPSTARFIATKLARRFVADDPPRAVIDAASKTFQQTHGDLREVLRTIFASPEFRSPTVFRAKIKKPLELVVSALRVVNAKIEGPFAYLQMGSPRGPIPRMGERLYNYEAPDGNPDTGAAWMNSNALLIRLDFANALATNRLQGITGDLGSAQRLLDQLGLPRPTGTQIEQTRSMMKSAAASASSPSSSMMMTMGAGGGSVDTTANFEPAAIVVATMLGSPTFQKR